MRWCPLNVCLKFQLLKLLTLHNFIIEATATACALQVRVEAHAMQWYAISVRYQHRIVPWNL